jgi:hypothetical protein
MLLPINGISEAFIQAEANEKSLKNFNFFMILFSVVYLLSMFIFIQILQFGIYSFILSNCISPSFHFLGLNMLMRIVYSFRYITNYFKKNEIELDWRQIFPHPWIILYFIFSFFLTFYGTNYRTLHLLVGIILFLISIFLMFFYFYF